MAEKTYVGTLIGITSKPDSEWSRIEISVEGLQYPVKADTRKAEILEAVKAVGTKLATWTVNEVESDKINPKSSKPYINRYLEGVEEGGQTSHAADAGGIAPSTASGSGEVDWDAKERRDFRSRAWAQAITASQHTGKSEETPQQIYERVRPLQRLIFVDIVRNLADQEQEDEPDIPF